MRAPREAPPAPALEVRAALTRRSLGFLGAALLLLLAMPPLLELAGHGYYVSVLTRILILAMAAVALDLVLGFGGMVSFGHAAFVGLGAYTVGVLSYHATMGTPVMAWPLAVGGTGEALLAWPAAMQVAGLAALLIGAISLRTSGIYFIMITLAFAEMLHYVLIAVPDYGGQDGFNMWARSTVAGEAMIRGRAVFYYVVLGLLVLVLALGARLVNSRFGMVLRGAGANERRMRALGFPTYRYKLLAFALSGALGGLAGALMANLNLFVSPAELMWVRSGELLVIVILGGMGTLIGPVLGAFVFLLLEEVLAELTVHWMLILGPFLVLVVLRGRGGLLGLLRPWLTGRRDG